MKRRSGRVLAVIVVLGAFVELSAAASGVRQTRPVAALQQTSAPSSCRDWRECQRQALEAAERKDYETFHDLAWLAIQTGPKNDPALMYLLARAQCLSGRLHDALVMLQRLAQMGSAADADTNDDFRATRALPGWPEVQASIERARNAGGARLVAANAASTGAARPSSSTAAPAVAAPIVGGPPPPAPRTSAPSSAAPGNAGAITTTAAKAFPLIRPDRVEDAVKIAMPRFAAGGLAYDAVSRRFVAADLVGRKLVVVNEGADHAVDLVRADSAGFNEIAALEIDARRGDLWVATGRMNRDWAIHKLQLLSGRPLKSVKAPDLEPLTIVDLGVTPGGTVLALDSLGGRVLALKPQGSRLETAARLNVTSPTSLAATGDEGIVYVSHPGGVARVDVRSGATTMVGTPAGLETGTIERLRSFENHLVAVQTLADGSRRLLRLDANASGRTITAVAVIDAAVGGAGPTFATISGNEISYFAGSKPTATDGSAANAANGAPTQFVVRRIRLR